MTREEWITALHHKVMPPNSRSSAERTVQYLKPRLEDLPAEWFTVEAINVLFMQLRSLNSADRVRKALRDFHSARPASSAQAAVPRFVPPTEPNWLERAELLRRDWDDPAGIRAKVARYHDDHWVLRRLGLLVAQWAPQHLSLLPPAILTTIGNNSWQFASLLKRVDADFVPPVRTVREQIDAAAVEDREPRARHLSPAQLDALNPLPNGRKRAAAT